MDMEKWFLYAVGVLYAIATSAIIAGAASKPAFAGEAVSAPDGGVGYKLSKEEVDACNAQGGCMMFTRDKLKRMMNQAYTLGRKSRMCPNDT